MKKVNFMPKRVPQKQHPQTLFINLENYEKIIF